jgi:hypothetical protein
MRALRLPLVFQGLRLDVEKFSRLDFFRVVVVVVGLRHYGFLIFHWFLFLSLPSFFVSPVTLMGRSSETVCVLWSS